MGCPQIHATNQGQQTQIPLLLEARPETHSHTYARRMPWPDKTRRHKSTFTLLHQLLSRENGGRWPIIAMDLGRQPVKDFE